MKRRILSVLILLGIGAPALAQDLGSQEIMVTGSRVDQDDYSEGMPAVGLRRAADFLIREVSVSGDTRDDDQRRSEIYAMIERALRLADKHGVQLAYGDFVVQPLTLENYKELVLTEDRQRPDSEATSFLVKAPLSPGTTASAAQKRVAAFIEAVPEVGRAQMDKAGEMSFSVVAPDSYRNQIAAMIAEDAHAMATRVGDGYAVEIEGLNMPVQWARSGPSEVMLYIPYRLTVVPKP